jgi:hypothetical protein
MLLRVNEASLRAPTVTREYPPARRPGDLAFFAIMSRRLVIVAITNPLYKPGKRA